MTTRDKVELLTVSIPDDDDALELYSEKLVGLCATVATPRRLDHPDGSAHLRSRLCGSTVTIDVALDGENRIADLGFEVKACSLGSAATAILARHAKGADGETLGKVRDAVQSMLSGAETIDLPDGWEEITVLAPARDVRSRHSAIMIVFDAANEAIAKAEA
ncbi:iron-sulfur cluster assembly scaffold protein [Hwanghaeella grinnelliae]|uniref:Iron-sulfur cluster assembly scaffold protein n=1 Tax=Hwanghaeella grinnelliae TaxID=2500179 RepID=A0A437QU34_9PROT|nr:iron-sulfur cluster assembly scaffold protein [Hwanghaeella grinnelliae]RVU38030.1 iron-sulfur cluster assembly scaffold protein [Hwanghaeella grinnelliae]